MRMKAMAAVSVVGVMATVIAAPTAADAFCGFYVSGADASLFNDATQVVLMREGTRTVLTMANAYKGPPQDFAMVVPVPVVLQKENVKTLQKEIFGRLDQLTAPRLVEYWEQDPCPPPEPPGRRYPMPTSAAPPSPKGGAMKKPEEPSVVVEAQFTVGEYEIVILSARDSTGLDTWLRQSGYKIPAGAEPHLRPYVQMGMKFFVAKVDSKKVTFDAQGRAALSPLRFHYDTDAFHLPIRLGMINSSGTQDLIVTILAPSQRYEVSNYDNVAIPTNMDVAEAAKGQFGAFYAALFDKTIEKRPGSVVTEYSWQATSCDPCPVDPLSMNELWTLGADVLPSTQAAAPPADGQTPSRRRWKPQPQSSFVVTRLHARYGKGSAGNDLFFRAAPPITGGREVASEDGKLESGAKPASFNNFQGRYAVRHPWKGRITCAHPQRGMWGGPPGGAEPKPVAASDNAFAPRGALKLDALLRGAPSDTMLASAGPTPVLSFPGAPSDTAPSDASPPDEAIDAGAIDAGATIPTTAPKSGCGACAIGEGAGNTGAFIAGVMALATALARRTTRKR